MFTVLSVLMSFLFPASHMHPTHTHLSLSFLFLFVLIFFIIFFRCLL
jgi:hypothetical protein